MLQDSSIRKSIDEYVKRRMREIPSDMNESIVNVKKVWKCENDIDFLYGYYVGKIEEDRIKRRGACRRVDSEKQPYQRRKSSCEHHCLHRERWIQIRGK